MSLKYFFLIFVLTIVATRIFLWLVPKHGPEIAGLQLHHYMYGLVFIVLYAIFQKSLLLSIGTALVVDEIPLFFIFKTWNWPFDHWREYHSWQSIVGILLVTVLMYVVFRFAWLPPSLVK